MIWKTVFAAALGFGVGLTAAGAALGQTETGAATPLAAMAQPTPPPPSLLSGTPTIKRSDPDPGQPTYSVIPPPDSSPGLYLPAVVLGYARSTAGCVVVGCDDGPQVGGASGPPPSGLAEPPPATPGRPDPR
jgi:hypothetical protein